MGTRERDGTGRHRRAPRADAPRDPRRGLGHDTAHPPREARTRTSRPHDGRTAPRAGALPTKEDTHV